MEIRVLSRKRWAAWDMIELRRSGCGGLAAGALAAGGDAPGLRVRIDSYLEFRYGNG